MPNKKRLLAFIPDPSGPATQPGGVLAASRVILGSTFKDAFDIRIVDTTMRAFPPPTWSERIALGRQRALRTLRIIEDWPPDVALAFAGNGMSFYEKSLLLLQAKRTGARTFISPRSGIAESWLRSSSFGRTWVALMGEKLDGFIVQSKSWRQFYAALGVPLKKLHVWYNSIDTASFADVADVRRPLVPGRPFRFLFLGWATVEKGLPVLLDAATAVAGSSGPPFELAVAGDGLVAKQLREGQSRLPSWLDLRGWVQGEGVREELRRADALVLPSEAEGFPNVVLEAMACALPIIATSVGAIPEALLDEHTGLLVPTRSVEKLADAMDYFRRQPEQAWAMGQKGLDRVRARFDRGVAVAQLVSILGAT